MCTNLTQSAAKLYYKEGSETIPEGSTLTSVNGSATTLTDYAEGYEIVQKVAKDKFIQKAKIKFDNKFDYSKVDYKKAKTPVVIICPEHGEFVQTPDKHLQSKFGCPLCAKKYRNVKNIGRHPQADRMMKEDDYLLICAQKYSGRYSYEINEWNGLVNTDITVVCPKHGRFKTNARSHILKNNTYGCPKCAREHSAKIRTATYKNVIEQLKKKYPQYSYKPSDSEYIDKHSIISVACAKHGEFRLSAQKHLAGQICPKCTIEQNVQEGKLVGGYCVELFDENPELATKPAVLYYLSVNNGKYYKIGITRKDVKERIKSLTSKAKRNGEELNFEVLFTHRDTLYNCFKIEQFVLQQFYNNRVYKKWSTELLNTNIGEFILNYLKHIPIN